LAKIYGEEVRGYDFVFGAPKSGDSFAQQFAQDTGLPYRGDICRKPEIPGEADFRYYVVARVDKFHDFGFIRSDVEGKDGVVLEDSIVAGATIVTLYLDWSNAGGNKLIVISAAPPMMRRCPNGVGFPEDENLIAHRMLDAGYAKEIDGEIIYDIKKANEFITNELRREISTAAAERNMTVNPENFRALYAPRELTEEAGHFYSESGRICDYCVGGPDVDYNGRSGIVPSVHGDKFIKNILSLCHFGGCPLLEHLNG